MNELEKMAMDLVAASMGANKDTNAEAAASLRQRINGLDVRDPSRDLLLAITGGLERRSRAIESKSPWRAPVPTKAPKSNPGGYK